MGKRGKILEGAPKDLLEGPEVKAPEVLVLPADFILIFRRPDKGLF